MSVGLMLKAEVGRSLKYRIFQHKQPDLLHRIEAQVLDACSDLWPTTYHQTYEGKPMLGVRLHPGGEDVEFVMEDHDTLTVTANTSSVGPGYHIFVCGLLHNLGSKLRLKWQEPTDEICDETGYFHSGAQQAVFDAMLKWLKVLSAMFFDGTLEDSTEIALAMPMEVRFESNARAITPLGPRETDWLTNTAEDPSQGTDFFAWWEPGLNAKYFLGRALVQMWSEVRWRPAVN